jgi:hypothetical protein
MEDQDFGEQMMPETDFRNLGVKREEQEFWKNPNGHLSWAKLQC